MKAYYAYYDGEEWGILIHGETSGKAKSNFASWEPSHQYDRSQWNSIRLTRVPSLDDKAMTFENYQASDFEYDTYEYDDGGDVIPLQECEWTNWCECEVCRENKI